jgi:PAS domain S-box-containing protein
MKTLHKQHPIHFDIVKKVFPLSILFLSVYSPYAFFIIHDYYAGWSQLLALVVLILSVSYYFNPANSDFICNILIALGFPVFLPWILSGGPSGHALWWVPVFALWVSYFSSPKRYFIWMGVYVLTFTVIAVAANYGMCKIAYSNTELLNILFATIVSTLLIYYSEEVRQYYEALSIEEARQITELQERYLDLLESAPDAILVFNLRQQIVMANLEAENVFGYTKNELLHSPLHQLILSPQTDSPEPQTLNQLFVTSRLQPDIRPQFRGKRKDGSVFSAEINTNLNEKEGTVTATIRDVSEREIMTNLLLKQNKQLENFTQIASHNLRGPVSNLDSLLYLHNEAGSAEEKDFLLTQFATVVSNLEETLNELLQLVEMNHDQKTKTSLVTFESVFSKITGSFEPEIKQVHAEVSANFDKAPQIEYTNVYLESIMQNLLSNALKYRSADRLPKIHFETAFVNGQTILTVSDNGSGMNLNQYGHKLFGFHQTFHSNPDAKGMGLFITKSQIDSMGGEITVESEVGIGTTFNIVFDKSNPNRTIAGNTLKPFQSN